MDGKEISFPKTERSLNFRSSNIPHVNDEIKTS